MNTTLRDRLVSLLWLVHMIPPSLVTVDKQVFTRVSLSSISRHNPFIPATKMYLALSHCISQENTKYALLDHAIFLELVHKQGNV
jgi:hypothetical protein